MKRHAKKIITAILVIVILVALCAGGMWLYKNRGKTYTTYVVKSEITFNGGAEASFGYGKDNVIKYTRDGASSFNKNCKEEWNVSYEMSNPTGDACGDYAAIADVGSMDLYIMDGTGTVNHVVTEHAIEKVSVAEKGITAVWMNAGMKDYITVYDIDGGKIVDMMTTTAESGFPVAMDISDDGTKLVTSYMYLDDNVLNNKLAFYNFGDVGSNYVDRLVGVKKYSDRLTADVKFANNNTVVAFSDKGFVLFNMEEYEEERKEVAITGVIESIAFDDNAIGVVTSEDSTVKVSVYNLEGNLKDSKNLTKKYAHFAMDGSDLIFYGGTELYITRVNGKDKANITLSMDVNGVLSVDGKRTYMLIGEQSIQSIELKVGEEKK